MEEAPLPMVRDLALALIGAVVNFTKPEPFRQLFDFAEGTHLAPESREFLFVTFREYWVSLKQASAPSSRRITVPLQDLVDAAEVDLRNRTMMLYRRRPEAAREL